MDTIAWRAHEAANALVLTGHAAYDRIFMRDDIPELMDGEVVVVQIRRYLPEKSPITISELVYAA